MKLLLQIDSNYNIKKVIDSYINILLKIARYSHKGVYIAKSVIDHRTGR